MAERFVKIIDIGEMWADACSVVLLKGALLKDNNSGKILLQLKFKNVVRHKIKAIEIIIKCKSIGGDLLEEKEYSYLDLDWGCNTCIGEQSPIYLNNADSREFEIYIKKIYYVNGTNEECSCRLENYKSTPLSQEYGNLSDELVRQYGKGQKEELTAPEFYSEKSWRCICGQLNTVDSCVNCITAKERIQKIIDKGYLSEELKNYTCEQEKRIAREKEEQDRLDKELAQKTELRNKQIKKYSVIAAGVVIVASVVFGGAYYYNQIYVPRAVYNEISGYIKTENYDEALAQMDNLKKYPDIVKEFGEWENIDSMVVACEEGSKYKQAIGMMESGNYEEAIDLLKDNSLDTNSMLSDCYIQLGCQEMSNEQYDKALEYFDSARILGERIEEVKEKTNECYIGIGRQLISKGSYDEALEYFDKAGYYSGTERKAAYYEKGILAFNSYDYEEALKYFNKASDYEESQSYIDKINSYLTIDANDKKVMDGFWYKPNSEGGRVIVIKSIGNVGKFWTGWDRDYTYSDAKDDKDKYEEYYMFAMDVIINNGDGTYSVLSSKNKLLTFKVSGGAIQVISIKYDTWQDDVGVYKRF